MALWYISLARLDHAPQNSLLHAFIITEDYKGNAPELEIRKQIADISQYVHVVAGDLLTCLLGVRQHLVQVHMIRDSLSNNKNGQGFTLSLWNPSMHLICLPCLLCGFQAPVLDMVIAHISPAGLFLWSHPYWDREDCSFSW